MTTVFDHATEAPSWLKAFFEEIDSKRFGDGFDRLFLPDTQLHFGVQHLTSFTEIKAHLQDFDSVMNTHHVVHEFWGSDTVNIFRGEIRFSPIAGGEEKISQVVHVLHMDVAQSSKIRRWYGAAGPGVA
jgi:hypothetical protein